MTPGRECPHCGAPLAPKAIACRECGSDAATGWAEDAETSQFGDPTTLEDREYEEFLARELADLAPRGLVWRKRIWTATVVLALLLFLVWAVGSCAAPPEGEPADGVAPSGPVMAHAHHVHRGDPLPNGISPWVRAPFPFLEVLPSWNVHAGGGGPWQVDLQLRTADGEVETGWLALGHGGAWVDEVRRTGGEHTTVLTDFVRATRPFDEARLRVRGPAGTDPPSVHAWALCFSDRSGATPSTADAGPEPPRASWQRRLDVPFRSQRVEDPSIAGRICSPTSVSMVLAYHGVDVPTGEVATALYDAEHDLYGNWPHNVQGAFSFGVPGHVARFNDWRAVRREIAAGRPLIVSISATEGQLTGAPYASTGGHLFVLCGFDERGDVLVNDPAASTPEAGVLTYSRAEMEEVWMRKGGTAYVLRAP